MWSFCLLLLTLVGSAASDQQKAAEAIQGAIFGDASTARVYVAPGKGGSRAKASSSRTYQASMSSAAASATASATAGTAAHVMSTSQAMGAMVVPAMASPVYSHKRPSGKQYSFQQLSSMSANRAPQHGGTFYRPNAHERLPVVEQCQNTQCHLSLVMILDSSGSVGYDNFQLTLSFVQTLLEILAVKADEAGLKVCTGIVRYSSRVDVIVDPCCENSMCRIVEQFTGNRVGYVPGSTNTAGAMKVARQMLQATASYKKVAILITDGHSNTGGSPVTFSTQMRLEDNINIVALGVTNNVNNAELRGISGMDEVTKIDYFDHFHDLANILLEANYMDESALLVTFESICALDTSPAFTNTCPREETSEETECNWGGWSQCMGQSGNCEMRRSCKSDTAIVDTEVKSCPCPTVSAVSHTGLYYSSTTRMHPRSRHNKRRRPY